MKLIHLDRESFAMLLRYEVTVLAERVEMAENEIMLFTAPDDYPKHAFQVVLAGRFGGWFGVVPVLEHEAGHGLRPKSWWILRNPFAIGEVAVSGRRYHTGRIIYEVHEADELAIRSRGIEWTGPLQNPGPRETPLRSYNHHEIARLFHRLWGKARDTLDYDKAEWGQLQALMREEGIRF